MTRIIANCLALCFLPILLLAQPETETFVEVEQMPVFQGCNIETIPADKLEDCSNQKMLQFVFNNLRYPQEAREKGIEGTIVASFIVDVDGSVTNAKIERGLGDACNEEVLRVVYAMPKWTPGMAEGKPVPIQLMLPVKFALDDMERQDAPRKDPYNRSDNPPPPPRPNGGVVPPPPPPPPSDKEEVFIVVEQMPTFGSCDDPTHQERKECSDQELGRYFRENLKAPESLDNDQQEIRTAVIRFTVRANGEIADVVLLRSSGNEDMDQHILAVASAMPDWRPGVQRGRPVSVQFTMPIRINQQ